MKTIAFAAAIVAAAVTVSATATSAFAQSEGRFGAAKVSYHEATGRYCVRQAQASSRVPLVQCRSKTDWAQQGVTITHKAPVQLAQR
ncbi:hypothetical protein ACFOKF_17290 [Sphingobium rhizovicinum]|uniref:Uncharacterized protein n=1 Tax=Sphingobium rhizovicinum TaxID=432308 RepID=A0ABV7NIV8_9SPHN